MQNKPNFRKTKMNLNSYLTKDYENERLADAAKTNPIQTQYKPNQSQYKPNSRKAKMNVTSILTKDYESERLRRCGQNKPNQTQFQTGYLTALPSVAQDKKEFSIGSVQSIIAQLLKNKNVRWSVLSF